MNPIILPEFDPIFFSIGPIAIRWYSLAYIAGVLITYFFLKKINKTEKLFSENALENFIPFIIISILVGGRLGYVLFYNFEYYLANPQNILAFWQGGMSFHGGLLGIIIGMIIFAKKYQLDFFQVTDRIAITGCLGIFFGRIANFINLELYGRVTDSKLGMVFPNAGDLPRHPSQLYEAFFEGILMFIILFVLFSLTKIRNYRGAISGIFLMLYGLFRFFLENFREPDHQLGFVFAKLTMGQMLSTPLIICGILIIFRSISLNKKII